MKKLIMMQGLPASGKTTKAREIMKKRKGSIVRINRDDLREMLHTEDWTGEQEGITKKVQKAIVSELLKGDVSVIVDDTNLGDKHESAWRDVADEHSARFEVIDVNTDYNICLAREHLRDKVGGHVVQQMALQYGRYPASHKGFVICDIDGTIADLKHRVHHVTKAKKDYDSFLQRCLMTLLYKKSLMR